MRCRPGLAAPGSWVVPYSKHLSLYHIEPDVPLVQEMELRRPFDGFRIVCVNNGTCNEETGESGGKFTVETHGMDGLDEARRTMNIIFNKDERNRLKIAF